MKAKLLLMLLFISFSVCSSVANHCRKKTKIKVELIHKNKMHRTPFAPAMEANDIDNCLLLTFQFSLDDADISIRDKDGHEIINEQRTAIYEGKTVSVSKADSYPYYIEIVSPTVDIQGEVILLE
ncbi:hypothetical protein [Phocaeicola sp.]